jgi:hypothetical protein
MSIRVTTICLTLGFVGLVAFADPARAEEPKEWHCHQLFHHKAEIDPREQAPLTWWDQHERAGNPQCVSPLADWSNTASYWGYNVGGGNPFTFGGKYLAGERRYTRCEGTWGWDYVPFYSHVRLRWWHGRKFQDGEGQYEANRFVEPFSPRHGPKGFIMNGLVR